MASALQTFSAKEDHAMQHIIIADSHAVCRAALENFIAHAEDDIRVQGVEDYGALLELLGTAEADLILIDDNLPGLPAAVEDVDFKSECPDVRVAIMTDNILEPEKYDVVDVLPKSIGSKHFLDGIKKILSGQRFSARHDCAIDPGDVGEGLAQKTFDAIKLTPREKQVLSHLLTGAVNKDIARALDLQVVTVKLHVRGICRKMGVKNRTQAALMAHEYGGGL